MSELGIVQTSTRSPKTQRPRVGLRLQAATEAEPQGYAELYESVCKRPPQPGDGVIMLYIVQASARTSEAYESVAPYDHDFLVYLDRLASNAEVSAEHVRVLWMGLRQWLGAAPSLPVVIPTPDATLQLSWRNDIEQVCVDVCADGRCEWFYMNHATGAYEGCETAQPIVPNEFGTRLRKILLG